MGNLDYADDVVKTPLMALVCRHIRKAVLSCPPGGSTNPGPARSHENGGTAALADVSAGIPIAPASADAPAAALAATGEGASTSSTGDVVAAAAAAAPSLTRTDIAARAVQLRHDRVRYCVQMVARLGGHTVPLP